MESLLQLKGRDVLVTLSEITLSWTPQRRGLWRRKGVTTSVPINEAVTVHLGDSKPRTKSVEMPSNQFTVYHVSRRSAQRWILEAVTFSAPDAQVAHGWVQGLKEKIRQNEGNKRPQRLLVFINPYGGRGKAVRIFSKKIYPLFQLAGIESDVIETTHANHARNYILEKDLQVYDGVVCVGGDGMFSELLHGLVTRTQRDNDICEDKETAALMPCRLRIGIIPAGSTDCVCFATVGINDPITSALHIIIGDTQPMDVCSSHHEGQLMRYSVSLIGYGFFGDVLSQSETMRWMGPLRYDVSGLKMVLSNRTYRGTVEFLEADDHSHPRDNTRCRTGCIVCSESSDRLKEGIAAESHCCTESWKKVSGSFVAINITGMSSACPKSQDGLSPTAHLADGTADLILVRECNTFQFLRHLSRHKNCKDQFALPYVDVYRIRAMRFIPEQPEESEIVHRRKRFFSSICGAPPETSCWNSDGEILDCTELSIRVHHQLIQLFARGIEGTSCS
ncbi:ceramide kinase [Bombina bombina]|uniref:ceramide kinase n=1 Tax=Bombina bombina TaxID=8345 RepID=UPI00235AA3DE|nr:ceramide kinase [Bombina bombina]